MSFAQMNDTGSSKSKFGKIMKPKTSKTFFAQDNRLRAREVAGSGITARRKQLETWWDALSAEDRMPYLEKALLEEKRFHRSIKAEREREAAEKVCMLQLTMETE